MTIVCEQCDGTGRLPKGERCPCREEDDAADERRKQMGITPQCPHANQLRHDVAPPPKFMQKLPIDKRGYPIPWFVDYINGEPEFRAMDIRKFKAAANNRLCWTCGQMLYGEEVFVIGPMCAVNRISAEPPSHRECAIYSAQNCPFLSRPHMIRREGGLTLPQKPVPGVMETRNPGVTLLWYTRRHTLVNAAVRPGVSGEGILFKLGHAFRLDWYCQGRPATRDEVLDSIHTGLPKLRETANKYDGPAGRAQLEVEITQALRLVPRE